MTKIKQVHFSSVESLQLTEKEEGKSAVGAASWTTPPPIYYQCVTSVQRDQKKKDNVAADEGELMHIMAVKKT